MAIWKATGRKPKPLAEQGECPDGFEPLWNHYCRLSNSRQGGMGPQPITYTEIEAYTRMHRVTLKPWQVDAIKHLDGLQLRAEAKKK